MPRVTSGFQQQIDFPCRKTRSRTKDSGNERSRSRAKPTWSTSLRKRHDPVKEAEASCNTLPAVSPKKRKNIPGKAEDLVHKDTENIQPKLMLCLAHQDGRHYSTVRKALHSSHPDNLLCREKELAEIKAFLENHLPKGKPGSLYISGAPGTGKTACLTKIMLEFKADIIKCQVIFVNCMALQHPQAIFGKIAEELVGKSNCPAKATQKFLEEEFTSSKQTKIIILDEMDQLESKNQEILYTMFEWPSLPKSKLILIGIANALDLTDRILPRLQARPKCKPELLHFEPYTREQIVKILQDRLSGVEEGNNVLDAGAIQFCARKVSAVAGDVRKALDICRRAVEVFEAGERKQQILTPVKKVESPTKSCKTPPKPKKVGISQIASIVAEVYGSCMVAGPGVGQPTIPLQQKLLICTFLLMTKDKKTKEVTLGKFHDIYCKICNKRKVAQLGQEDFIGLCYILETRGVFGIKRAKDNRLMKVTLKIDEKEVDYTLQDKTLLSSILQEGV